MQFDILTIFPDFFDCFLSESLIKRAKEKGLIKISIHDLRDWAQEPHKVVDNRPFGGGFGMVMKVEPIYRAVKELKKLAPHRPSKARAGAGSKVIFFTPRARKFNQKKAFEFSKLDQLILLSGRYEGIDERVAKYIADEKVSMGDYVLLGGGLPAMCVIEAVSRLVPGVIGIDKPGILKERVTKQGGFVEYAQYTRPEIFEINGKKRRVPKVLLSGDHKKIKEWRKKHSKIID